MNHNFKNKEMNKNFILKKVPVDYEIGPSVEAADLDGNINPVPSPECYNMETVLRDKNLVYNRGVVNSEKQKLYEYEERLISLGIPYKTNEDLLDITADMERKGLFS